MSVTSLTFTIDHPTHQGVREEVELWVPPYGEPTSEDYEVGYVQRCRGDATIIGWTRHDDEAWPIEPSPSELISELAGAVGYLNYGASTTGPWARGPCKDYLLTLEKKEVDEYCEAYDEWMEKIEDMDQDIYEPSYFSEYMGSAAKLDEDNKGFKMMKKMGWEGEGLGSTGDGVKEPVLSDCANIIKDNTGRPKKLTPEMIFQVQEINHEFNLNWNDLQDPNKWWEDMDVPDVLETVELIRSGDKHGVGKCRLGGVYIPNGVIKHLSNMECGRGDRFKASLVFTGGKFPWKIGYNGVMSVEKH